MPAIFLLALVSSKSATDRLVRGLFDDTFAGIHHLAWFDWAMLVPYFTILLILSVFGIHRYEVIRAYFKHRKNATGEPPTRFEQLPPVTIQLPLYNERYVVERLIEEVVKIEYPKGTGPTGTPRHLLGTKGYLWPPGFTGPNMTPQQDGANLLIRNADMLVRSVITGDRAKSGCES